MIYALFTVYMCFEDIVLFDIASLGLLNLPIFYLHEFSFAWGTAGKILFLSVAAGNIVNLFMVIVRKKNSFYIFPIIISSLDVFINVFLLVTRIDLYLIIGFKAFGLYCMLGHIRTEGRCCGQMMNKEKIYTLAKLYTVYIAISTVIFGIGVYFVLTNSVLFEILTESGFANVTSMIILAMHTALYATGGNNFGMMLLNVMYSIIAVGSFGSMLMIFRRKKYGFFLISLVILIVDSVCHVLVGGIVFPAVIGLGVKIFGVWVLLKAYKIYKNNKDKEKTNELN